GFVTLNSVGTGSLEGLQERDVDRHKLVKEGDRVDRGATVSLAKGKARDGSNKDGSGMDAGLLGLKDLPDRVGVLGEGEGLVVLKGGFDVVVVRVKPLDHFEGRDIDAALLVATAHGEVLVNGVKLLGGVTLGDSLNTKGSIPVSRKLGSSGVATY